MKENSVIFKGIPDGIIIILDEKIPFCSLKEVFLKKVNQAKNFFEDANISITFKGRELSENEEMELLEIISNQSGLNISFLDNRENLNNTNKNTLEKHKEKLIEEPKKEIHSLIFNNNQTYYHKGSLRSGQRIDFSGSVVVIGDVNPGAQILAEGNVIILGKLKGFAHAGCKGAEDCFIAALHMKPTQLIIKESIIVFPEDLETERGPEYVYIKDGEIFVEGLN